MNWKVFAIGCVLFIIDALFFFRLGVERGKETPACPNSAYSSVYKPDTKELFCFYEKEPRYGKAPLQKRSM